MRAPAVLIHLLVAPVLLAASPRITFERVLPPAHDLGRARDLAVIHSVGNSEAVDVFVASFVDQVNQRGVLQARDARESTGPADAYLSVRSFSCETFNREGEGSARDHDGARVRRKVMWVDAVCTAGVDVMGPDRALQTTLAGRGEGASSRVEQLTDEERAAAVRQAARYAAIDAAGQITPRRVREHILLDETAPAFAEGMALIESGRLREARARWEAALRKQPGSAALHLNLYAVCEALGDTKAAQQHARAARRLARKE